MRAKNFYLTDYTQLTNAIKAVDAVTLDGKTKVTISNAGSKSSKQRGLQWMWYEDISKSGVGGELEETPEGTHLACKQRFAVSIFMRDDDFFCDLYTDFMKRHGQDQKMVLKFVDQIVSTEDFNVSQMAEYLTNVKQYYLPHGVNLREPAFRGLLDM
jgi:hypothetical protein